MQRMFGWFIGLILALAFVPTILVEVGRLLVPLIAKGLAVALVVGAIWFAVRLWQVRRYGGPRGGSGPWRF